MTSLLANRAARRRGDRLRRPCWWPALLLMAFSSNPVVRELQNGVELRLPADPGRPRRRRRAAIASVGAAISEIDRLRDRQRGPPRRERATRGRERPARGDPPRERAADRPPPAPERARLPDGRRRRSSPASRPSSGGWSSSTTARDDGIEVGDVVVAAGGALAGRVIEVGPDSAKVVLLTDGEFDGHRPADDDRGDRRGRRPARAASLVMRQIDAERAGHDRRRGRDGRASSSAAASARRTRRACSSARSIDVRRDANDVVQTAYLQPAADLDKLEYVLVITRLRGRPAADRAAADRLQRSGRHAARGRAAVPHAERGAVARRLGERRAERHAGQFQARAAATLRRDEGHRPRRRHRHAAVPADDRHQQAPAADLRPADDLLPDRDACRDGHPRGHGHRRRQERRRRRRAARRRLRVRARPDLSLPARRARDRPRDRARPRLRRRRRVLLRPRRQHPARRRRWPTSPPSSRRARATPARCSTASRTRSGSASPSSTRTAGSSASRRSPSSPRAT